MFPGSKQQNPALGNLKKKKRICWKIIRELSKSAESKIGKDVKGSRIPSEARTAECRNGSGRTRGWSAYNSSIGTFVTGL